MQLQSSIGLSPLLAEDLIETLKTLIEGVDMNPESARGVGEMPTLSQEHLERGQQIGPSPRVIGFDLAERAVKKGSKIRLPRQAEHLAEEPQVGDALPTSRRVRAPEGC